MPAPGPSDLRDPSLRFMLSDPLAGGADARLPVSLTGMIDRDQALAAAVALLRDAEVHLLTLTGPGGVGKTRLAIAAASEVVDDFPDGVAFVGLAPIADTDFVMPTIARTLGLRDMGDEPVQRRLINDLTDKRLLLVLDNFEHLVAAGPEVREILATCSGVSILVTSRVRLRLSGEHQYPVSPLIRSPRFRFRRPSICFRSRTPRRTLPYGSSSSGRGRSGRGLSSPRRPSHR